MYIRGHDVAELYDFHFEYKFMELFLQLHAPPKLQQYLCCTDFVRRTDTTIKWEISQSLHLLCITQIIFFVMKNVVLSNTYKCIQTESCFDDNCIPLYNYDYRQRNQLGSISIPQGRINSNKLSADDIYITILTTQRQHYTQVQAILKTWVSRLYQEDFRAVYKNPITSNVCISSVKYQFISCKILTIIQIYMSL